MMSDQTTALAHSEFVQLRVQECFSGLNEVAQGGSEECFSGSCPRQSQQKDAGVFLQGHRG